MKVIDKLVINAKNVVKAFAEKAQGDETLVIKVMLIVIAVALGLMFRNQIGAMIQNLIGNANNEINGMFSEFGVNNAG